MASSSDEAAVTTSNSAKYARASFRIPLGGVSCLRFSTSYHASLLWACMSLWSLPETNEDFRAGAASTHHLVQEVAIQAVN